MDEKVTGEEIAARLASFRTFGSGSNSVDTLLGGGYKAGKLVEVFGKSNTGKTQLAMQAALVAARSGERALFIDTEGTFRPERIERMAGARGWETRGLLRRIVYVRVTTAAQQMDIVRAIRGKAATSDCRMVVVDTLTRNFTLDYPGGSNLIKRQGALDVHLSDMARDAVLHGRAYLLTNRVTFAQAGGDIRIGGSTLEQLVHTSLHLTREGDAVRASRTDKPRERVTCRLTDSGFE
ncbi:MAG: AAA family ATPase [Nitrososphaerales archaeon]|nr:AAA family ATPase [Nitrososphaerales archaeon]